MAGLLIVFICLTLANAWLFDRNAARPGKFNHHGSGVMRDLRQEVIDAERQFEDVWSSATHNLTETLQGKFNKQGGWGGTSLSKEMEDAKHHVEDVFAK